MTSPTAKVYGELDQAYDALNEGLFGGTLPNCLMTLQRKKRVYGYFCFGRFLSLEGEEERKSMDEIALNPEHLNRRPPAETLSTLAHEMVHLWQHHFGKPTKSNPHNREWADKMKSIGLQPRGPNGEETGRGVSHVIMSEGPFADLAPAIIAAGFAPEDLGDAPVTNPAPKSGRYSKYVCPVCNAKAQAKPGLDLRCGDHGPMLIH
jgi:hypothetical protein